MEEVLVKIALLTFKFVGIKTKSFGINLLFEML